MLHHPDIGINWDLARGNPFWGRWPGQSLLAEFADFKSIHPWDKDYQQARTAYYGWPMTQKFNSKTDLAGRISHYSFIEDSTTLYYHSSCGPALISENRPNNHERMFMLRGETFKFQEWCEILGISSEDRIFLELRYGIHA